MISGSISAIILWVRNKTGTLLSLNLRLCIILGGHIPLLFLGPRANLTDFLDVVFKPLHNG